MLRYNQQTKISYLCCISMKLHYTLRMYSNILCILYFVCKQTFNFVIFFFLVFDYVLFNECPSFLCDLIFYGKIAQWPISYVVKVLMEKLPRTVYINTHLSVHTHTHTVCGKTEETEGKEP